MGKYKQFYCIFMIHLIYYYFFKYINYLSPASSFPCPHHLGSTHLVTTPSPHCWMTFNLKPHLSIITHNILRTHFLFLHDTGEKARRNGKIRRTGQVCSSRSVAIFTHTSTCDLSLLLFLPCFHSVCTILLQANKIQLRRHDQLLY